MNQYSVIINSKQLNVMHGRFQFSAVMQFESIDWAKDWVTKFCTLTGVYNVHISGSGEEFHYTIKVH